MKRCCATRHGQARLLLADADLTRATGLLAKRYKPVEARGAEAIA